MEILVTFLKNCKYSTRNNIWILFFVLFFRGGWPVPSGSVSISYSCKEIRLVYVHRLGWIRMWRDPPPPLLRSGELHAKLQSVFAKVMGRWFNQSISVPRTVVALPCVSRTTASTSMVNLYYSHIISSTFTTFCRCPKYNQFWLWWWFRISQQQQKALKIISAHCYWFIAQGGNGKMLGIKRVKWKPSELCKT